MKRRRIEREKCEKKENELFDRQQEEEKAAADEARKIRRIQNLIMTASVLAGLLIAGWLRRDFGEYFPYVANHSAKGGGRYYDPLMFWGLLGGCGMGAALGWIFTKIRRKQ